MIGVHHIHADMSPIDIRNVSAGYTHFFAGRFIRQNGGEDVNYGTVWASYKF
jgi:hypothetical protein